MSGHGGRRRPRAAALLAAAALGLALPGAARAADFAVTSTADAVDADPGDGRCQAAAGGCTLRAAVQEADAADGPSKVTIPAGRYRLTIAPQPAAGSAADAEPGNGDLDLSATIDIRGAPGGGTILDGGGIDRVLEAASSAVVHLTDLTITGGDSTAGGSQEIDLGGGVLNKGEITLDRVELVANKADGGGGMFSIPGTMPVIRDSLVAGNTAFEGGGLRIDHGGRIVNTTITGNTLLTLPPDGIQHKPGAVVVPTVDEISGYGGGIDHRGGANLVIESSTITGNHAVKGGGGIGAGQGYAPASDQAPLGRETLRNTIIAGNTSDAGPANCRTNQVVIQSLGHNLASDASCFLTATGDLPSTEARLAALAGNGGPLRTQALRPGSPAIDAGAGEGCPTADARGVARPQGPACDIGAFEYVAPPRPVSRPACRRAVRLPRRLRHRARSFDVVVGRSVVARKRRPEQAVRVRRGARRATLRVRLRSGRTVSVRVRPSCRRH